MTRVIHTGQALVDLVVEVGAIPRRGGNVMAQSFTRYAGGSVSVLAAAARSGAHAVHAGAHGTGPNGDLIREALAAEGVALSAPPVEDLDTALCVVMVEPTAERTFVTTLGAERQISPESLGTSAPVAGDLVCVTGYSLLPPTRDPLLEWLDSLEKGVRVVLDPGAAFAGLDPAVRRLMLGLTSVWTSNAEEAHEFTGLESLTDTLPRIAEELPAGNLVVVRDGPEGCYLLAGEEQAGEGRAEQGPAENGVEYLPGFPQEPVDTNGAGDAHTGVLVAELAAGTDPHTACRRANAAGAIKVTRRGPATAPARAEIDAFLQQ
ncbi:PfkB family carbohydrate kinase [Ornithinimicrobium sp. F0845]|uniref:PfkB family carbohydrate kinase n=1 Tax=Ornithinimicrobium sp. F0845 TaxID=2926412 RepID=UPI001FF1AE2D|nr:PfkB family carbohydrate kinase [Ornithinimicrobium sp. F0845]MCK0111734.1 PfkB family carbohydrate kinase [Ornithinimicrobium sp. F0845]